MKSNPFISVASLVVAATLIGSGCGQSGGPASAAAPEPSPAADHGKTVPVTQSNFSAEVETASGVVVVDFWAPWCGPCRVIGPILEKLSVDYDGRVKICKLNVDENQDLSVRFQANAIPMLVLFKDGKVEDRLVGARNEAAYRSWFEKYL